MSYQVCIGVTLTPLSAPRRGWAEAFAKDPPEALTPEDHDWLDAPLVDDEDA